MVTKRKFGQTLIPAGLEAWVANRLVSAHFRSAQALILGHLFNVAVIVAVFAGHADLGHIGIWAAAVVATCGHRYYIFRTNAHRLAQRSAHQIIRQLEWNTVALAALTGCASVWLMQPGPNMEGHALILAVMAATLTSAAGFTMRTLPRAAVAYILINSSGAVVALLQMGTLVGTGAALLMAASAALLARMALTAYNLFVVRILREREASAAAETVRMLLNDFEDQGSDWLFELDIRGGLVNVSERFAEATGKPVAELERAAFTSLFEPGPEVSQLVDHLTNRRAFRGLALPLVAESASSRKWWSVSGRPAAGGPTTRIRYRGVISDVSAEKQAEARVRHLAHYDSLTELPNRMMFNAALNRAFSEHHQRQSIALLFIDVDHFKAINDMYGHPVGDAFLQTVATRLHESVRSSHLGGESQLLARLGGDEFAVMLVGEDAADKASRLAAQLVEAMASPFDALDHEVNSGISVGIAIAPEHATTAQVLQSQADIALYVAKERGRNCWAMFAPGMDTVIQERHALERDLRSALLNDELRLYLQPLVDVETGQQTGFEALIRWEHPERGLIPPLEFIPIAEETGLIVPIGEWVLRTALHEAASWDVPLSIAVNLSPIQLRSGNLLPTVVHALADSGIDPARLELEITEGVLLHDSEANIALLNRLHALGVKIALDDFGTGYASLNYLLTFPFDKIKIDRSFITELETRQDCREIVGAVIGLANRLGMCTLAEGVEQEAQLTKLREQGCEMVQGWLFGKAVPAEHYRSHLCSQNMAGPARTPEPLTAAPKPVPAPVQAPKRRAA